MRGDCPAIKQITAGYSQRKIVSLPLLRSYGKRPSADNAKAGTGQAEADQAVRQDADDRPQRDRAAICLPDGNSWQMATAISNPASNPPTVLQIEPTGNTASTSAYSAALQMTDPTLHAHADEGIWLRQRSNRATNSAEAAAYAHAAREFGEKILTPRA